MDRHGLLTVLHKVNATCIDVQRKRNAEVREWKWDCTAVMYPESVCVFCKSTIRSPFIWLLKGEKLNILVGVLYPIAGEKVKLLKAKHAHMLTDVNLCLGNHADGISLLASPLYLRGMSIGKDYAPKWIKKYWQHDCREMRDHLTNDESLRIDYPHRLRELLQELEQPWSMSLALAVSDFG